MISRLLIVALLGFALAGCVKDGGLGMRLFQQESKGYPALSVGLKQYDDGNYADSARNLNVAIEHGLTDGERASAHKTLAFMHCIANRERQCRDEFRKALVAVPDMELDPAETGHPIWGPVFRSVKAAR